MKHKANISDKLPIGPSPSLSGYDAWTLSRCQGESLMVTLDPEIIDLVLS